MPAGGTYRAPETRSSAPRRSLASTVAYFHAKSTLDPDVMRAVDAGASEDWVLVTTDASLIEEFRHFEWDRYAIGWVVIDKHLRGAAVEAAKTEVVQRWAHEMAEQARGDHYAYYRTRHYAHPPSLVTRRRGPCATATRRLSAR